MMIGGGITFVVYGFLKAAFLYWIIGAVIVYGVSRFFIKRNISTAITFVGIGITIFLAKFLSAILIVFGILLVFFGGYMTFKASKD